MTREVAIGIMIGLALLLIALGAWGWHRRLRRDSGLRAPVGEAPASAAVVASFDGFYVATTRHGEPLERLAIRGLAFRSRVDLVVTTEGVALDLTGQPRVFLDAHRLVEAAQATVAIDRVVERDGLVRLSWTLDAGDVVDSYFRAQGSSARAVVEAIDGILTAPAPTASAPAAESTTVTGSDA